MSLIDISTGGSMGARATRGRVPITQPLVGGEKIDILFRTARITRSERQHDSAVLAVSSPTLTTTDGLVDKAISFFYGSAPRTEAFYGYVKEVQVESSATGTFDFSMGCLGTTSVMSEGHPRWWDNKSIPSVVQDLALYNLLGYAGHPHTHLWRALAQTDQSDWRRANDLAARIGYTVFNHQGVVLCYDPLLLYSSIGPYATLRLGQSVQTSDRQLVDFQPQEVSDTDRATMGIRFGYFTTSGGVHTADQRGDFKRYAFQPILVRDQNEATVLLDAFASYTDRWKQHAQARMWGDADIYPSMAVDVVTSSSAQYQKRYNGKWLVRSVTHDMDRQQFQTQLVLSRPDTSTATQVIPFQHYWVPDERARPTLSLQDGLWVSSWTDRRIRSVMS